MWLILAQPRVCRDSCGRWGGWPRLSMFSPGRPRWHGVICWGPGQPGLHSLAHAGRQARGTKLGLARPPGTVQPRASAAGQPGTLKAGGDPGLGGLDPSACGRPVGLCSVGGSGLSPPRRWPGCGRTAGTTASGGHRVGCSTDALEDALSLHTDPVRGAPFPSPLHR